MKTWQGYTVEQLKRAAQFYSSVPTGQYDDVAEDCIRYVLAMLDAWDDEEEGRD